jgi:hypothetical protein
MKRRGSAGIARRGIAIAGIAAMVAVAPAPVTQAQAPPTVTAEVRLAATTVPPFGLVTSFLGNQVLYCSIICPLLVETAVTGAVTTLQTPVTFLNALQSGNLFKAIGITAASVTGPTNAAAQAAILADGTKVAPRAFNALQVGIVGLLNVLPAAADGLPGILRALQTAREDTFTALNAPVVPNPTPTAMPRGVLQVVVVEATNVVAAIIFPAFNHLLSAIFDTPDAFAQELASTGDPFRAVAAGVDNAVGHLTAAVTVVADSVVTGLENIHTAIEESRAENRTTATFDDPESPSHRSLTATPDSDTDQPDPETTEPVEETEEAPVDEPTDPPATHDNTESRSETPSDDITSTPPDAAQDVVETKPERSDDKPERAGEEPADAQQPSDRQSESSGAEEDS